MYQTIRSTKAVTRTLARALLTLQLALPLSAQATSVWVATSSEKLRPNAAARTTSSATLTAAKNEFEAFQIAVTANSGALSSVTATATALTGPQTLSAPRLFREGIITLTQASSEDGATGDFFDALIPDVDDVVGEKRNAFPFIVPSGSTRALWVEIHVPADATPGTYTGSVTLSAGSTTLATVPVSLTVYDFALPSTSSLRTHFGMYYGDLPTQHGVSGDDFSTLRARYAQLGLDHRISIGGFDDGNSALSHIEQFYGPLISGTASTQLVGAKLTTVQFMGSRATSTYASWASFFKARGWFDQLFDYTCDEPPATCQWTDITSRNTLMKAADPDFRSLVTTTIQDATTNGVLSSIDILVPIINYLYGKSADQGGWAYYGSQLSSYANFPSSGTNKEVWTYQSCMSHGCGGTSAYFDGWPSYMIDAASVRARAEEWFSFAWGLTGELYWETTYQYSYGDPWTSQLQFSGNGDGTLFYPGTPTKIGGTTHIPVASIRLKMIREGMEDFEYLKLLSAAGDATLAKQLANSLFPNPWTMPTFTDLLAARETIANRIVALTKASSGTDTGTTTDGGSSSSTDAGAADAGTSADDDAGTDAGSGGDSSSSTDSSTTLKLAGCSAGDMGGALTALGLSAALFARRRRT